MKPPAGRRVGLAVAALLLTTVAAEVGLQVREQWQRAEFRGTRSEAELITMSAPPPLLYRLKPNFAGVTNSAGFRDLERAQDKPTGTYRIAAVGDSVTMQLEIPFEQLYVQRLQHRLEQELPEMRVEILNFGVTGYGAAQTSALLARDVATFSPDAVVWQFHFNDGADPILDGGNGQLGRYYRPLDLQLRFHVDRLLALQRKRAVLAATVPPVAHRDLQRLVANWTEVTRATASAAAWAHGVGAPVFLFLYPSWPSAASWEGFLTPGDRAVVERLRRHLEELGFSVLDLLPLLEPWSPVQLRASPDDPWHPNAEGHRVVAEAVADWLVPLLQENARAAAHELAEDDSRVARPPSTQFPPASALSARPRARE